MNEKVSPPDKLSFGFVGTPRRFDPLWVEDGQNQYLAFATEMKKRAAELFERFSLPVVADPKQEPAFLQLCGQLADDLGYELVPIIMCDEAHNPCNEATMAAAEDYLGRCVEVILKMPKTYRSMGPTGEPWKPGCEKWGTEDPKPLPDDLLAKRIACSSAVHARVFGNVPKGSAYEMHAIEHLIPDEACTINTLNRSCAIARQAAPALNNGFVLGTTADTAHIYNVPGQTESVDEILAINARLYKESLVTHGHVSQPGERLYPLAPGYPLMKHLVHQWDNGLFLPQDIEMFDYTFAFLVDALSAFSGKPNYDPSDIYAPHIETATRITSWYDAWRSGRIGR